MQLPTDYSNYTHTYTTLQMHTILVMLILGSLPKETLIATISAAFTCLHGDWLNSKVSLASVNQE